MNVLFKKNWKLGFDNDFALYSKISNDLIKEIDLISLIELGPLTLDGPVVGPFNDYFEYYNRNFKLGIETINRLDYLQIYKEKFIPSLFNFSTNENKNKNFKYWKFNSYNLTHMDINASNILVDSSSLEIVEYLIGMQHMLQMKFFYLYFYFNFF